MAILSDVEALEKIKKPEGTKEKYLAIQKSQRQNVHCETIASKIEFHWGHRELLRWLQEDVLRNQDAFDAIKGLFNPPFTTNELTESIFSDVPRIFNPFNRFVKLEFTNPDDEERGKEYLKEIGDNDFWKTEGLEAYKTAVDSFVIVDMPSYETATTRVNPYYYLMPIENLHSIDIDKCSIEGMYEGQVFNFRVEWACFLIDEKRYAFFDEKSYRVFEKGEGENYQLIINNPHKLGYCPVKPFWATPINPKSKLQKKNQITNSISELDWLLGYSLMGKSMDLTGPFPIYSMYTSKCTYVDETIGARCNEGWLSYTDQHNVARKLKCPKCAAKFKPGPNNIAEIPAPQDKDQPDLLSNGPVKIIAPEFEAVESVEHKIERMKERIYQSCAGKDGEAINDQAVNEKQVVSIFESKESVLGWIAWNFEIIHSWTINTVLRLKFGDSFIKGTVKYSDKYFLNTEEEQIDSYDAAKKSGLPMYELASRREMLQQSKNRNNPDKMNRANILDQLEPFPDYTTAELTGLMSSMPELVSNEDLILKINFNSFIKRFEREVGSLLIFGMNWPMDVRIQRINEILKTYGKDKIAARAGEPQPADPANGGDRNR